MGDGSGSERRRRRRKYVKLISRSLFLQCVSPLIPKREVREWPEEFIFPLLRRSFSHIFWYFFYADYFFVYEVQQEAAASILCSLALDMQFVQARNRTTGEETAGISSFLSSSSC